MSFAWHTYRVCLKERAGRRDRGHRIDFSHHCNLWVKFPSVAGAGEGWHAEEGGGEEEELS